MTSNLTVRLSFLNLILILISKAVTDNLSTNATVTLPNDTACGLVKATDRLYGTRSTEVGEFPWIVAIEYRDVSIGELKGIKCIGTLINNRYVLTAAHCLDKSNLEPLRVWLGEWKLSTDPDCLPYPGGICGNPVEKINIESKIPHTGFSKSTGEHNIALLRLKQEIQFSEFIQPICLSNKNIPNQDRLVAISWGTTAQEGSVADVLQSVTLPHVPIDDCERILKKTLPAKVFCAGGEKGKDTCQGDGGAPLVKALPVYDKEHADYDLKWFQQGITSWGVGCGREGYPAVYTSVSGYIEWIRENILP